MSVSRNDLIKQGAQWGAIAATISTLAFILFWWFATLPQTLVPVVRIPDWLAIGVYLISAGLVIGLIFAIPLGLLNGALIGFVLATLLQRPKALHPQTGLIVGGLIPFISIFIIGPLNGEVVLPFYTFEFASIWIVAYVFYITSGAWVGRRLQHQSANGQFITLSI